MPDMVMHSTAATVEARDYRRIEKAIGFIDANFREQPTLKEIASYVNLSEYHFQRLFRRWAGISPKRFLQYVTAEHASRLLRTPRSVLDAAHESGLSGTGRLHDLLINIHAVTPGQWKHNGADLTIQYGIHPTPFGDCLVAMTERGICELSFLGPDSSRELLNELKRRWPKARFQNAPHATRATARRVFNQAPDRPVGPVDLFVQGTNFQIKVWEALLRVPAGAVISYQDLARRAGCQRALRAVASAVARNPIAYLIPCHRVIRKSGVIGEYRWGGARKKALIAWEAARSGLYAAI
jgi:AraC family transcriptional regulator of adaptative response/methylated-DNA-[protein]-cysteine methyltransferase